MKNKIEFVFVNFPHDQEILRSELKRFRGMETTSEVLKEIHQTILKYVTIKIQEETKPVGEKTQESTEQI